MSTMENPYSINIWSTRKQWSNNLYSIADRFLLNEDLYVSTLVGENTLDSIATQADIGKKSAQIKVGLHPSSMLTHFFTVC